jgi:predicted ATPase/class 3 adenylate cyclase/Tfp pilus assembly protein PilF
MPNEIVTFLFTDIEGSTKLWEQHPDVMPAALARHDEIVRKAIESQQGRVFKTVGDAFHAVFVDPRAAILASVDAQRQLQAADFSFPIRDTTLQPRVRMALHTGSAEQRDNDYFGPALNRTARLLSAAHGGQILLSLPTRERLTELGNGLSVLDLGERRLKDLVRPERVFQLLSPDLTADFPPLRSLEAFAHNLPVQLTSFVGREREMAEVKRLLTDARLLTLTGVGGTGKTRLSLQVAADLLEQYTDGVWIVELASIGDPALVAQATASVFGVREEQGRTIQAVLTDYLQAKHLLLLLDNCEHLIEACAQLAEALLRACPKIQILASSREALGVAGETSYRIPSLSIPDVRRLPPLETLSQYESVRLFVERAHSVQSTFALTTTNAPYIAQICQRLDGIPLAIELAAARTKALSPDQIVSRLDDRFRLLTGGSRTALPRQQTLQALIDWSHDLLSLPEQILLRRLSVFVGGWTLEAAEAVCADDTKLPVADVLDLLMHLVDKSLVVADEQSEQTRYRYRKLETIRQYARTKLMEAGESVLLRDRHLHYFMRFAEQAKPEFSGATQKEALDRAEIEHDNLRTALEWSLTKPAALPADAAMRLAGALGQFWDIRGYWSEGREWLQQAIETNADQRTVAQAEALWQAGFLANRQETPLAAQPLFEASYALAVELQASVQIAWSLLSLGIMKSLIEGNARGRSMIEESLSRFEALHDQKGMGHALFALGNTAVFVDGDPTRGLEFYRRGLDAFRTTGNSLQAATILRQLGFLEMNQGRYAQAMQYLEETRNVFIEFNSKPDLAAVYNFLGLASLRQGRYTEAHAYFEEGLALNKELGNKSGIAAAYGQLGWAALTQGEQAKAKKFFEVQLQLNEEMGNRLGVVLAYNGLADLARLQGDYEGARQTIRRQLELDRELGQRTIIPIALHNLGHVLVRLQQYADAIAAFQESLIFAREQDNRFVIGLCIMGYAGVMAFTGKAAIATRLLSAITAYFDQIHYYIEPADRSDYELYQARARLELGDAAFDAEWRAGQTLDIEAAIQLAETNL